MKRHGMVFTAVLALSNPSYAEEKRIRISGQFDAGYRYYLTDGQYEGQGEAGFYGFVGFQLDGNLEVGTGKLVFKFSGLADDDNDRTLFNAQKAYYANSFDNWDLVLGFNIENWGVSNGRTIVNVLNARDQTNQVGSIDLIGTPMVNANVFSEIGTLSLYVLGGDVQDNFGGQGTRQRGPFYTDDALTVYEDDNSVDVAVRFANSYSLGGGSLDIGASVFWGTNREALRFPNCTPDGSAEPCGQFNADLRERFLSGDIPSQYGASIGRLSALTAFYQEITQLGLTAVYANGNTQLRFEGFLREASDEVFGAAIVGGDQSFHNFFGGEGTLIVAAEYHYDDRSFRQPVTVFEDDLFFGINYSANDAHDSQINFGAFYDLDDASKIFSLSMSRRIGDRARFAINASHISASEPADQLFSVKNNSFVEFSVSTFF